MDEPAVIECVHEVLGDDGYRLTFTERTIGWRSISSAARTRIHEPFRQPP